MFSIKKSVNNSISPLAPPSFLPSPTVCVCVCVSEEGGCIYRLSLEMSKEIRRRAREKALWLLYDANLSEVSHLAAQQGREEDLFFVTQEIYRHCNSFEKTLLICFLPLKTFNATSPWKFLI